MTSAFVQELLQSKEVFTADPARVLQGLVPINHHLGLGSRLVQTHCLGLFQVLSLACLGLGLGLGLGLSQILGLGLESMAFWNSSCSLCWHLFWAFSKASRWLTKWLGELGSACSKALHCLWALLACPTPPGPPFFVLGALGALLLCHCLFQNNGSTGFSKPLGGAGKSFSKLFHQKKMLFQTWKAFSKTTNSSATLQGEGCGEVLSVVVCAVQCSVCPYMHGTYAVSVVLVW